MDALFAALVKNHFSMKAGDGWVAFKRGLTEIVYNQTSDVWSTIEFDYDNQCMESTDFDSTREILEFRPYWFN